MYRKHNKVMRILLFAALFTLMFSMVAFADDAVMDILDQPRFGGAVKWVNKIGKIVDNWFMAVISFVSFFIISASCLRNVLAGAYCVFPKFWDGVHDAHQMTDQLSISSAMAGFKGATSWTSGSITKFLMGLLPDIKVLTDFENAEKDSIDYKQYFMKAIPQCVVAVFVGVFIYNGLYRDVMSVTSRFGVAVVDNALKSVKPDEILEQMTNISVNINYPVKGAPYGTDKIADTWVSAVAGHGMGNSGYDDLYKKANKQKYYNALSNWSSELFASEFLSYSNTNQWKDAVEKRGSGATPDIPAGGKVGVTWLPTADETQKVALVVCGLHELSAQGKIDTTHTDPLYVWAYISLTDGGYAEGKDGDVSVADMTLAIGIPSSIGAEAFPPEGIQVPAAENCLDHSGEFTYGGAKFNFSQNGKYITIKSVGGSSVKYGEFLTSVSGGASISGHTITRLYFQSTNDSGVTGKMQCLYQDNSPRVWCDVGDKAALEEKIAQTKRADSAVGNNSTTGGSNDAPDGDDGEEEEDSDLDEA